MESSGRTGGREDEVRWGRVRGKEEEFGARRDEKRAEKNVYIL